MEAQRIKELSSAWLAAKKEELLANEKRVSIEKDLIAAVGAREEGSQSTEVDEFKITTTGKLSYKADADKLAELTADWPEVIRPVEFTLKVSDTKLKKIRAEAPEYWTQIARVVEVKPQKTAVSIALQEVE